MFKKNNPGCNCCGVAPPCQYCDPDDSDDSRSVTIGGVTDSYCECDSILNSTHIVTRAGYDPCQWTKHWIVLSPCTGYAAAYAHIVLRFSWYGSPWKPEVSATIQIFHGTTGEHIITWYYRWRDSGGTIPYDCTVGHTLTHWLTATSGSFNACGTTAPTFVVN